MATAKRQAKFDFLLRSNRDLTVEIWKRYMRGPPSVTAVKMQAAPESSGIRLTVFLDAPLIVTMLESGGCCIEYDVPSKIAKPAFRDYFRMMQAMDREFRAEALKRARALRKRLQQYVYLVRSS